MRETGYLSPPSPSLFLSPLQSFSQPLFLSSSGRRPSDKLIHVLSGTGLSKQFKNEILSSSSLMYDTSTSVPGCLFHLIWPVGFIQTEGSFEVTRGPEEHLCKLLKVKWDTGGAAAAPLTSRLGRGESLPISAFITHGTTDKHCCLGLNGSVRYVVRIVGNLYLKFDFLVN